MEQTYSFFCLEKGENNSTFIIPDEVTLEDEDTFTCYKIKRVKNHKIIKYESFLFIYKKDNSSKPRTVKLRVFDKYIIIFTREEDVVKKFQTFIYYFFAIKTTVIGSPIEKSRKIAMS